MLKALSAFDLKYVSAVPAKMLGIAGMLLEWNTLTEAKRSAASSTG